MLTQNPGASKRRTDAASGNPTGKRSRVSRACDQCRAAREKCDGHPICSTCATSNRGCTYTTNPKKRGIQPGYIRTLELTLTWLFQNSDAETVINRKLSQEGASSVLLQKDTRESNKLHRSWRRSRFCKDVEKLLSGADIGDEGGRSPETDEQDSDTEEPPHQPILNFPESPASTRVPLHAPAHRQTSTSRLPPDKVALGVLSKTPITESNQVTSLPSNRWQLFDIYFAYTHCWFPISEKHDILKLSYSYPETGLQLSPNTPSSGDHAEVWSILALASLQEHSDKSNEVFISNRSVTLTPRGMYDTARKLIPRELGKFQLGHVKALLLLALFNISQSCADAAWFLVGHASRVVLSMEHNQQTPRYKHVYLGCFFLDQLLSLQLGRPPYLRYSDIRQIGKIDENGLEEWAPWAGCHNLTSASAQSRTPALTLSTYNRLIDLMGVMNLVDFTSRPLNIPLELTGRLEGWEASSSATIVPGVPGSNGMPSTPPTLLLQAFYRCFRLVNQPAQNWAQRMFDVLEYFQGIFAGVALPPVVHCLLDIAGNSMSASPQTDALKVRLDNLRVAFDRAWGRQSDDIPTAGFQSSSVPQDPTSLLEPRGDYSRSSFVSTIQMPTPESVQMSTDPAFISGTHLGEYSTLPGNVLPDLGPSIPSQHSQSIDLGIAPHLQGFDGNQIANPAGPPTTEQWHPTTTATQNIETFFDELASLDGAERVESQPQFMQNLGFAPDARIADLLTSDFGQLTAILGYPTSE